MARTSLFLVSDDHELNSRVNSFAQSLGLSVQVYSSQQWNQGIQSGSLSTKLRTDLPALVSGSSPVEEGAKILPFPGNHAVPSASAASAHDKRVHTMNELESIAITNAIFEFGGNLTEAAKALGIGRATLYRKVKQYNIDPSAARKRRAA